MEYTTEKLKGLLEELTAEIEERFNTAYLTNQLEDYLSQYGIYPEDTESPQLINRKMKILVVGDLRGKQSDYVKAAKSMGFKEEQLEFIEFDKFKSLSLERLKYSNVYSDIIVGAVPHKGKDLGKDTSLVAMFDKLENKGAYPKLIEAIPYAESNGLKFTITDFKKALFQTKLITKIYS